MDTNAYERPAKRDWYVLHVKPRTEKKVARIMAAYRCFCHLPLYLKITKVQRRKVRRWLPVFPGYVFTKLFADERVEMLKTNLVVRTITVQNPRRMIHQLRQIANVSKGILNEIHTTEVFKAGEYVRITSGPFRGTEGYVKRAGRDARLCLNVDILGTAIEVTVSPVDIERADRPKGTAGARSAGRSL